MPEGIVERVRGPRAEQGEVGGYHCWVQLWTPETGWFPIDASEAFKHPDKRDLFFGTHPADRIHLTTGRDLVLAGQSAAPLNYFVYPHVESEGGAYAGAIEQSFSYREVQAASGAATAAGR